MLGDFLWRIAMRSNAKQRKKLREQHEEATREQREAREKKRAEELAWGRAHRNELAAIFKEYPEVIWVEPKGPDKIYIITEKKGKYQSYTCRAIMDGERIAKLVTVQVPPIEFKPADKSEVNLTDEEALFKKGKKYLQEAREMMGLKKAEAALNYVRKALEAFVKAQCITSGIDIKSRENTLEDLINQLGEKNMISNHMLVIYHRTRQLCNRGVHTSIGENVSMEDARTAVDNLRDIYLDLQMLYKR